MASPRSAQTRKSRTDEKLYRAVIGLLRSAGVDAVTVEAVAAASGVAKTTIYRRHADRVALLRATLDHYIPRPEAVADLAGATDPRASLRALVTAFSTTIEQYVGTSLATLIAADEAAAQAVREHVIQPRVEQIAALLEGWRSAGLLRPGLDVDLTVSTIIGTAGVTYARYGAFPPGWPDRLVDHLWPLLRPGEDVGARAR